MNERTCSYCMSVSRSPIAAVIPGATGTSTSRADTASASATPWSGPAPPKGTRENSRGSTPRATEFERIARAMFELMTRMMPRAASVTERPSFLPTFPSMARLARSGSMGRSPPSILSASSRPRATWASVTVGSSPPLP